MRRSALLDPGSHDWRVLWTGGAISQFGTAVSSVAIPFAAFLATHSVGATATVSAVSSLAATLPLFVTGALVDRMNAKHVLLVGNAVGALVTAYLALRLWQHQITVWELIGCTIVLGLRTAFVGPTAQSVIRSVVPKQAIGQAVALNQGRSAAAQLLGPPTGGLLFALGPWWPFVCDAISYAANAGFLTTIRADLAPVRKAHRNLLGAVGEGMRWIAARSLFRRGLVAVALLNVGLIGLFCAVNLALLRAGTPHAVIGLVGTAAGVGGLLGALVGATLVRRVRMAHLFGATTLVMLVAVAIMVLWPRPAPLAVAMGLLALPLPAANAALQGYQLTVVPKGLLGRVNSTLTFASSAVTPLGPALAGAVMAATAARPTFACLGALMVLACAILLLSPEVRRLGTPDSWQADDEGAPESAASPGST